MNSHVEPTDPWSNTRMRTRCSERRLRLDLGRPAGQINYTNKIALINWPDVY